MRSPFPGMDPFLESQEWEDFHATLNTVVRELLSPRLEPQYVVRVERRVYVEVPGDRAVLYRRSDIALLATSEAAGELEQVAATTATLEPFESETPMPQERRETYLVIRLRENMEVVTVLETLSPANKRPGGDGRREYLSKREAVLQSQAHLVEFDLLRGGLRLPMGTPIPEADYYAIVSRRHQRPKAAVYAWTLRDRLPTIPVPLRKEDPDVPLDLQEAFAIVYARARYDLSLRYDLPLEPPPSDDDARWLRTRLAQPGSESQAT